MTAGTPTAVGVDLGTTYTCAAVADGGGRAAHVVQLSGTSQTIPSVVSITEDGVVAGEAAERRLVSHPSATAREFKRRLGDATPIVLGTDAYPADVLSGYLLREVLDRVERNEGVMPSTIGLAHPASWGPFRLDLLRDAARHAGVDDVVLVPEPIAAAVANRDRVEPGSLVAVYDLGGGTFDAAIVRIGDAGTDDIEVVGTPEGVERLGGIDFDQAVLAHVDAVVGGQVFGLDRSDPNARGALMRLRAECQAAKEHLSQDSDVDIPVSLPGLQTSVRMTRAEFEAAVRPRLADSLAVFDRVAASAGSGWDDIAAVLLVGGSSNIPVVAQLVGEHTGRPVVTATSPHLAIASGTAMVAADQATESAPPAAAVPSATAPSESVTTPTAATTSPPATPGPAPTRRSRVPLIVGGVVAVAAAVGAVVLLTGGDDDSADEAPTTTVADAEPDESQPDDDTSPTEPDTTQPDDDTPSTEPDTTQPDDNTPPGDGEASPPIVEVSIQQCTAVADDTVAVLATDLGAIVVGPSDTRLVEGLGPSDCSVDPTGGTPLTLNAPGIPVAGTSFGNLFSIVTDQSGLVGAAGGDDNRECDLINGPGGMTDGGVVFPIDGSGAVARIRTAGNDCSSIDSDQFDGITATAVAVGASDRLAIGGVADGVPAIRVFRSVNEGTQLTSDDIAGGLQGVDGIVRCADRWCVVDLAGGVVHLVTGDGVHEGVAPLDGTPLADAVAIRSATPTSDGPGVVTAELGDGTVAVVTLDS